MKQNNTINFFDVLITIAKHKILVIKLVFGITFVALVISLIWPKTYRSSSEIVQTRESIGSLGGLLQNFSPISSGQNKVGGETMLVILSSQSLKDKLIAEFNLAEVYGTDIKEALYKQLQGVIEIEEVREGGFGFNPIVSIEIGVLDKNPERAQAMNKFILQELNDKMESINFKSTQDNLKIIETRLEQSKENLAEAEAKLNEFQNKYGILEITSQLEALITSLAQLKSSIIQKEIELQVLQSKLDSNSNYVAQKRQELSSMKKTYDEMVEKSEDVDNSENAFYPLFDMPDLMLQYTRLYREVEIQNTIYELIIPQLEQQKLFLANKSSGIRIIDPADMPTYKYSPKRAFIVLGGFFFSVLLSLFIVLLKELQDDEDSVYSKKMSTLKKELSFKVTSKES